MHVYQPSPYVPRHMRKKVRRGGPKEKGKQESFQRAAMWSKRFIYQKAKALDNPRIAQAYSEWTEAAKKGNLRRSTGGK